MFFSALNSNMSNTLVDSLPKGTTVETVILLSRKDVHERIKFDLNIEELNRTSQSK